MLPINAKLQKKQQPVFPERESYAYQEPAGPVHEAEPEILMDRLQALPEKVKEHIILAIAELENKPHHVMLVSRKYHQLIIQHQKPLRLIACMFTAETMKSAMRAVKRTVARSGPLHLCIEGLTGSPTSPHRRQLVDHFNSFIQAVPCADIVTRLSLINLPLPPSAPDVLQKFTNVKTLAIAGCSFVSFDIPAALTNLETLTIYECPWLTKLAITHCAGLKKLEIMDCEPLTHVDLSHCHSLKELCCSTCGSLTTLDPSPCQSLESLDCTGNNALTAINLSQLSNLQQLECWGCPSLQSLNLDQCIKLVDLNCTDCRSLTTLDVSPCTDLERLCCSCCSSLEKLDLKKCPKLKLLGCFECVSFTSLNVTHCPELVSLRCQNCSLPTLDLSNCPKLTQLHCSVRYLDVSTLPFLSTFSLWWGDEEVIVKVREGDADIVVL